METNLFSYLANHSFLKELSSITPMDYLEPGDCIGAHETCIGYLNDPEKIIFTVVVRKNEELDLAQNNLNKTLEEEIIIDRLIVELALYTTIFSLLVSDRLSTRAAIFDVRKDFAVVMVEESNLNNVIFDQDKFFEN